ncbi:hypothetical protein DOY81_006483 [Sarcophaga bullata]|nr:hypothetical protein DOY81_006483 [Sarcophaga bullata]
MALRLLNPRFGKSLCQVSPVKSLLCRNRSNLTPIPGWFDYPSMFHPEVMLKHAEVIPIVVITALGMSLNLYNSFLLTYTRDDVRFLNKNFNCDQLETRVGPMYPPPIRKRRVYHQQFENNKKAIRAMQTSEEEGEAEIAASS